ncbi:MAG: GreA/GreB family elongation factor [Omnitrophica WOR_2 bacterium]
MDQSNQEGKNAILRITAGMHVELEMITSSGERERMALDIVPDSAADFANGFLGEGTPLAKAILGRRAGSRVPYRVGDAVEVQILAVSPTGVTPDSDAALRRQETIQKAVQDVERKNLILFASSFSGKWGDYDPDAVEKKPGDDKPDSS